MYMVAETELKFSVIRYSISDIDSKCGHRRKNKNTRIEDRIEEEIDTFLRYK